MRRKLMKDGKGWIGLANQDVFGDNLNLFSSTKAPKIHRSIMKTTIRETFKMGQPNSEVKG